MTPRMYENASEKQKAYRDRLRARGLVLAPPRAPSSKRPSRPARLTAIENELRELATEYEGWLEALPDNMADSARAEELTEIAEALNRLADEVNELEPPRIGRPS